MIVAALFAGLASGAGNAATDPPEVHVGSELEFPPYAFVDESGRPAGFSVDLIKAVAEVMGLSIKISSGPWDTVWNDLAAGRLDVLPIVAKLPERTRLVDFSLPHTETFDAFFVRRGDHPIRSIEAAGGKEIVAMRSDAAHHALLERNFQGRLVLVDTIPEGLSLISSGKHDAFLCSKLIGTMAIKKHGLKGLTAGPPIPDYKRVFSFAVKKGDTELLEKLNQGLLIIKTKGEYDRIYEKWLTADDPWLTLKKYLFPAGAIVTAAALIVGFWVVMLQLLVKKRTRELAETNVMLSQAREELEERVAQRTAELTHSNRALQTEITERKEAEDKIHHQNAIMEGIGRIFREALACDTEEELGRTCLAVAEEVTRSKFGFIGEIGADGFLHDIAISDPGWELCTMYDKTGHRRPPGNFKPHGIYGRVLLDGKSFYTNDPASHPDSIGTPEGHPPLKAFLGVPLIHSGRTVGMIAVGNREGGYRRKELESLEALAPAIVEALHRVRAEQSLRKSEERLNRSQEIAHLGSWELDLVNNRLSWSDEVYRIFGLKPQEFGATYEAFLEAVHPDDRAAVDAAYSSSLREGRDTYEIEHRVVKKSNGEVRIVHEKCGHIRDGSGRIIRSVGMVHDITERKRAKERIAHLASFPEMNPNPIVETDPEGRTTYINPAMREQFPDLPMTGTSHPLLSNWPVIKAGYGDGNKSFLFLEAEAGGKVFYQTVYYARQLNLIRIHLSDITDRKRAEEELRNYSLLLEQSNRELQDFAFIASHDLQEPLRKVIAFGEFLKTSYSGMLDEKGNDYLARMIGGAERMRYLIEELLLLSRVTTRALPFLPTDLGAVVRDVLEDIEERLRTTDGEVRLGDLPVIEADKVQMRQLFQNLISNALKFHRKEEPPVVHVTASIENGLCALTVKDNGIGFDMKYAERIFRPFQRLHGRGVYEGSGMGLTICKKIVDRHGGEITVESARGIGTAFTIKLPVHQSRKENHHG
ncbi:MAG: transporter substrate-binding domain-containing protein [bacterium]